LAKGHYATSVMRPVFSLSMAAAAT